MRIPMRAAVAATLWALGTPACAEDVPAAAWNKTQAGKYLDARAQTWFAFAGADRGEGATKISCISCHSLAPFAIARPVLRKLTGAAKPTAFESKLIAQTKMRVAHWKELDSEKYRLYYDFSEQKKKESWGTEAVLNALALAFDDFYSARSITLPATKAALANLWQTQIASGKDKGSWDWLNFGLEPWETTSSRYFGAALAALAVGTAPGYYHVGADAKVDANVEMLRAYLRDRLPDQNLNNKVWLLWASTTVPDLLSAADREAIIAAVFQKQQADGGWSLSSLGTKSPSGFTPDAKADGYATGLVLHALQEAGITARDARIAHGLAWLRSHQSASGAWPARSVNRKRDPNSHAGKFMSDAATAYAVLALSHAD